MSTKRILALFLTFCMLFSLVPGVASAEELDEIIIVSDGISNTPEFNNGADIIIDNSNNGNYFKVSFIAKDQEGNDYEFYSYETNEIFSSIVYPTADPATFIKDGFRYEFSGWNTNGVEYVAADTNIAATYTKYPDSDFSVTDGTNFSFLSTVAGNTDYKSVPESDWNTLGYTLVEAVTFMDGEADNNTIEVSTADQLAAIATAVNNGDYTYSGKTIKLTANIDLSAYSSWTPIGNGYYKSGTGTNGYTGAYFAGTFDGNEKTITGLNVSTSGNSAAGLFGIVNGGTIKKLTVDGATVSSETRFAGAIAGGMTAGGTIEDCEVTGEVEISSRHFAGGIAGMSYGTIRNCSVKATGMISADDTRDLENERDRDGDDVGGIVGYINSSASVSNCTVNSSDLTVKGIRQVGAVVGKNDNSSITNSSSNAKTVFTIASVAQLEAFRDAVNSGDNFAGTTVELLNNITLEGKWEPIGNGYYSSNNNPPHTAPYFSGTFNGNGNTITGLDVSTSGNHAAGLFGIVNGGTIKNLIVDGATVSSAQRFAGAIVGGLTSGTIESCQVTGAVTISGKHFVGGLAGLSYGTIKNCSVNATGTISADDADGTGGDGDDVGGLVGFVQQAAGKIENGDVSTTGSLVISGIRQVGGIAGAIDNSASIVGESSVSGVTVKSVAAVEKVENDTKTTGTVGLVVGNMTDSAGSCLGTASNVTLEITTAEQLKAVATAVNTGDTFSGNTVKLGNHINLNNAEWTPIGNGGRGSNYTTTGNYFAGTFDGNGKTISGLSISDYGTPDSDTEAAGLFGAIQGATIKDFTLSNPSVSTNCNNGGAAVGFMNGGSVSGIIVNDGSVSSNEGAGAIVGRVINSGTISKCQNNGCAITTTKHNAGGIVGAMYHYTTSANNLEITDCSNSGAVTARENVGGIVGYSWGNVSSNTNSGTVTLGGSQLVDYAGGIIGEQRHGGTVNGNINSGVVSGASVMGGIVGFADYRSGNGITAANIEITDNTNTYTNDANVKSILGSFDTNSVAGAAKTMNGNTPADQDDTNWTGEGTQDNPYVISNEAGLRELATKVNAGNSFANNYFKLADSVDTIILDGNWTPIGQGAIEGAPINGSDGSPNTASTWKPFSGTFNGNGKAIIGLSIDGDHYTFTGSGLFGATNGATIKNLTIDGADISGSGNFVGAVAGYTYATSIENVDVTGVLDINSNHFVGGAVGYASNTDLSDVDVVNASGYVSAIDANMQGQDGDDAGGLVGYTVGGTVLSDCNVSGSFTVSAARQGGGLVGLLSANSTVTDCSVSGVTVECAVTDAVADAKETKITFGGLAGAMHSSPVSITDSSVTDVTLTFGNGVTHTGKNVARIGKLTAGTNANATFAVNNSGQTGSGNIITNVALPEGAVRPVAESDLINGHEHTYTIEWRWAYVGGQDVYKVQAIATCIAKDDTQITVLTPTEGEHKEGYVTYTVTYLGQSDSLKVKQRLTVTYNGEEEHDWGDIVTLRAAQNSKWYVTPASGGTEVLAAIGQAYRFAVSESVIVRAEATDDEQTEPIITSTMVANGDNSVTYHAKWSMPSNAIVKTVTIYRGFNRLGRVLGKGEGKEDEMTSLMPFNVDLLVRNGDYTFNIKNLETGIYQNAQLWIEYSVDGGTNYKWAHAPADTGLTQIRVTGQ